MATTTLTPTKAVRLIGVLEATRQELAALSPETPLDAIIGTVDAVDTMLRADLDPQLHDEYARLVSTYRPTSMSLLRVRVTQILGWVGGALEHLPRSHSEPTPIGAGTYPGNEEDLEAMLAALLEPATAGENTEIRVTAPAAYAGYL